LLAKEVAGRADLVIFVLDGDITETELTALRTLVAQGRPVIVALNKKDLFTTDELDALLQSICEKTDGVVDSTHVIAVAAQPRPQTVAEIDERGSEHLSERARQPDV
jgi:predicted GTPase